MPIKDEFWGFSVVLIRLPTLLEASGINTRDDAPFRYQLSKINPNTQQEEFYLPEVELHKSSIEAIDVPDGEWKLYVFREDDDSLSLNVLAFSFLGLVLSVTGALFVWHYARQPERLNRLVQEKTAGAGWQTLAGTGSLAGEIARTIASDAELLTAEFHGFAA